MHYNTSLWRWYERWIFEYAQYRIEDIASAIDELIEDNESKELDSFNQEIRLNYLSDIIAMFNEARKTLRLAAAMAQRVDWLVSGDGHLKKLNKKLKL
jgi:DNA repair ATPase RecN